MMSGGLLTPLDVFGRSLIFWLPWTARTMGSGSEVASIIDRSLNGNTVTQVTALQRPLLANGIHFDGTDDNLFAASNASLNSGAVLVVALHARPHVTTSNRVPICRSQSTSGSWSMQTNTTGLRFHVGTPGTNFGEVSSALVVNSERTYIWAFDGGGATNADRLKCWINGTAQTVNFTGTIPATIPASSNTLSMGCFSGPSGQYWDGTIKCALAANSTLSDAQRAAIERYFGSL